MSQLPTLKGVHHLAFRCKDAEETRAFYEDVLGLELSACLAFNEAPGTGKPLPYMHLFFEFGDGNFIAFFDEPEGAEKFDFKIQNGFDAHIAMEVADASELQAFVDRLDQNNIRHFGPIDHGFCHSLYFWDPSGVALEITFKDPKHDAILAEEASHAREDIRKWAETKAAFLSERAE